MTMVVLGISRHGQKKLNKDKHTGKPWRTAAQEMYWLEKYWLCQLHGVEKRFFMILEISEVAAKNPSTYTDWWCDNVSLAWVLSRHCSLSISLCSYKSVRYQFQKTKIKSAHKLTKNKSNITQL